MIDSAAGVEGGALLRADVCVVGAGAAGISVALRLLHSGLDVLLLEAGTGRADAQGQALYRGEVADPALHSPPDRYRQRRFGGSTTIWGGRCVPFDPIDFRIRPWVAHSGWPVARDLLLPFYAEANALCEAGVFDYDASSVTGGMRPLVNGWRPAHFSTDGIERFSLPTDFARRYRRRLERARRVRVLLGAAATRIELDPDGCSVRRLLVSRGPGDRVGFAVAARRFVLATGGLEVPRLLLASADPDVPGGADGVGNVHGLVGRFYMCHMAGTLGTLRLRPGHAAWHGYERDDEGVYCRRRLALSERAQREQGLLNLVVRLHHPRIPDPAHRTGALSAIFLARRLIRYEYAKRLADEDGPAGRLARLLLAGRHARNVLADSPRTAGFLLHWLHARRLAERKFPSVVIRPRAALYSLDIHGEQAPNPLSRVTLGTGRDALGLPVLRVDWRPTELDLRSVREAVRLLAADVAQGGIGRLDHDPETVDAAMLRDGAYGGHHIGTARMAASPREGVVDPDGRVHGVRNLHVAGSAVFPTSGQANPTLTIVALSLRLADRLATELREPAAATRVGA